MLVRVGRSKYRGICIEQSMTHLGGRVVALLCKDLELVLPIVGLCAMFRGALREEGRAFFLLDLRLPINFARALSLPSGGLRLFEYQTVIVQDSALKLFGSR